MHANSVSGLFVFIPTSFACVCLVNFQPPPQSSARESQSLCLDMHIHACALTHMFILRHIPLLVLFLFSLLPLTPPAARLPI